MENNIQEVVLELDHLICEVCDATDEADEKLISKAQSKLDNFLENLPYGNAKIKDALIEHIGVFGWPELILALYNSCTYIVDKEVFEWCREQWPNLKPKICDDIEARFRKD